METRTWEALVTNILDSLDLHLKAFADQTEGTGPPAMHQYDVLLEVPANYPIPEFVHGHDVLVEHAGTVKYVSVLITAAGPRSAVAKARSYVNGKPIDVLLED